MVFAVNTSTYDKKREFIYNGVSAAYVWPNFLAACVCSCLLKGNKISENFPYRGVFELVIMNKYLGLKEGKLVPLQTIMSNEGLEV